MISLTMSAYVMTTAGIMFDFAIGIGIRNRYLFQCLSFANIR